MPTDITDINSDEGKVTITSAVGDLLFYRPSHSLCAVGVSGGASKAGLSSGHGTSECFPHIFYGYGANKFCIRAEDRTKHQTLFSGLQNSV